MPTILDRINPRSRKNIETFRDEEIPLRATLFGLEQLQSHAKTIAAGHELDLSPQPDLLLDRLRENRQVIDSCYDILTEAVQQKETLSPAAEWLLDNFYLVQEQFETTRRDLPKAYALQLPKLKSGPRQGCPRVYDIAYQLVSHTDGRLDVENIHKCVQAYQTVQPLDLGELWAVPIMLRLALLENIRRVAHRIAWRRRHHAQAARWTQRFLEAASDNPKRLILVLADFVRSDPHLSRPFVTELFTQLQGQHTSLAPVLHWLEGQVADAGQVMDQVIQAESNEEAADHVSIGNAITSQRSLESFDWKDFVEQQSIVEATLHADPAGVYADMDFDSRDRYRHVVELLAARSETGEQDVAAMAIRLATEASRRPQADPRTCHVGYWLVGRGVREMERRLHFRMPWGMRLRRVFTSRPLCTFMSLLTICTVLLSAGVLWLTTGEVIPPAGQPWPIVFAILVVVVMIQPALSVVNWLITLLLPPRPVERMDFSKGIPANCRTAVIVPAMLTSTQEIDELLEHMEIRYLGNRDPHLVYALLTDFRDADQETCDGDADLTDHARKGIDYLNERYATNGEQLFFWLHRPRVWNESEGAWMGRERKRGKIEDFNELVLHGRSDSFSVIVGPVAQLRTVRYAITLDADTQLPPNVGWKMIAAMAHPLNHPVHDEKTNRVIDGFGMLQPRVDISLPSAGQSLYARMHAGDVGLDIYTRQVSNVYHDLFGRGAFIGKGVYDIQAFSKAVGRRFPDNYILSHDLLEGCHARCGFLNDVEVIESYPSRYLADVSRRHRWTRGDWQIARYLTPWVRRYEGSRERNPLDIFSRWQIFDNLRRSLFSPTLLALLAIGWFAPLPGTALGRTLVVLAGYLLPWAIRAIWAVTHKPSGAGIRSHLRKSVRQQLVACLQELMTLIMLPFEAVVYLDAIIRVLWRKAISRRRLLEWTTASEAERRSRTGIFGTIQRMWIAPFAAIATGALVILYVPAAMVAADIVLVLWLISPMVAHALSMPRDVLTLELSDQQQSYLRMLARRQWRFFEAIVTAEHNHLPPDNYQELPVERVASRTSPTNIGLYLLSSLSAYDFGYATAGEVLDRIEKTFGSLEKLERFRGHFLNWYDTKTLQPLRPRYISAVDSGNLSGALLTLKGGFDELCESPAIPVRWHLGLVDTLAVLDEEIAKSLGGITDAVASGELDGLHDVVSDWQQVLATPVSTMPEIAATLDTLHDQLQAARPDSESGQYVHMWLDALLAQVASLRAHVAGLCPLLGTSVDLQQWQQQAVDAGLDADQAEELWHEITQVQSLQDTARLYDRVRARFTVLADVPAEMAGVGAVRPDDPTAGSKGDSNGNGNDWVGQLREALESGSQYATSLLDRIERLTMQCSELREMEHDFLYDPERKLMRIGFDVEGHRHDQGFYDLLASEARLGSFVAVAEGDLPYEHWFKLGRQRAPKGGMPSLVSWSGSMFEYLMPMLVMPTYDDTLLDQTCRGAVQRQIKYGQERGVPWGISESGYNQVDADRNYQYHAFGVPGLGLKRGLASDLVIAPYASVMAVMVAPQQSYKNIRRMVQEGFLGQYGLYEAVDYTPSRVFEGNRAIVHSYMAHHTGMSMLSLAYSLLNKPMQRRMLADPQIRAATLLLQERVPDVEHSTSLTRQQVDMGRQTEEADRQQIAVRVYQTPTTPMPEVHLLSNNRFHVMMTNSGGGYIRWGDLALTRWQADAGRDNYGLFCYVQDIGTGHTWSATHQPTCARADFYEAIFSQGAVEYRRLDHNIEIHTRVAVSPEDDIGVRRLTITNRSRRERVLELTTYGEVVLTPPHAEASHPAFNSLFIKTEVLRDKEAILCTRRPRTPEDKTPWMMHAMLISHGESVGEPSYETDRSKFIGRGRTTADPAAMHNAGTLSNSAGAVLDPIIAVRRRIRIAPGDHAMIDIITGAAETREEIVSMIDKYRDNRIVHRVFEISWTHSQIMLHHLGSTEEEAQQFARLANAIFFTNPALRARGSFIARNQRGQSALWSYGVSGDVPIVLLRVSDSESMPMVRKLIQAHAYWRNKGVHVDLVIWTEAMSGYRQTLLDEVVNSIATGPEPDVLNQPSGIHVRPIEQISEDDQLLFEAVARVVLNDRAGTLAEQIDRRARPVSRVAKLPSARPSSAESSSIQPLRREDLTFFNGMGGFTGDGREYVIAIQPGMATPAPWVNVLANPQFGTIVSESGGSYTWFENAHEFRLTPWYNDPVQDTSGEALYIRDEETGLFWSPSPLPTPGKTGYICRHGHGYTVFEHSESGIATEATWFVAIDAPVKFISMKIRNESDRSRRLSITGYFEMVLGDLRQTHSQFVTTRIDPQTEAILATNPWNSELAGRVVFLQASEKGHTSTGDRLEFIGRNGSLGDPEAMHRKSLSNRVGAGMDPCAAKQMYIQLPPGQSTTVAFALGAATSERNARELILRYSGAAAARQSLERVWEFWKHQLGAIYVETPDQSFNVLANYWMLYQTMSCRMWGRSGYYQSGGAFGYRDQLQDSLALLHSRPDLVREHLLRCAERQFRDGDVQHWWHPPVGRGVRTRISDDYLWLPYVAAHYVTQTGDTGVLDEQRPFLEGRRLRDDEDDLYDLFPHSDEQATLYRHCVRAIKNGLRFGEHGLPLMGSGDWNDGMDRVGIEGRGESVWLGFFLYEVINRFLPVAEAYGDNAFVDEARQSAEELRENLRRHAWDGKWYRRAYSDDGIVLGSAESKECRIDSISQSWSVISGAGDRERRHSAMSSVYEHLVSEDLGLIKLLDPPFDQSDWNPGYIKSYVPGVRENGGQYTHAAIWTIIATAMNRDIEHSWKLWKLINPVHHGDTPNRIATYKVEPYVIAADVYTTPGHEGRGGWTWYTGSSGWMYRLMIDYLLGIHLEVDKLRVEPLVPPEWKRFAMHYRWRATFYHIEVVIEGDQTWNVRSVKLDGADCPDKVVPLRDDQQHHQVVVTVG